MVDGTPRERPQDAEGRQALMEFRELFAIIERAARAAASHMIQAADCEDVVQYVCIDAWERWSADREYFRQRSPAGWATVAARHQAYSVLDAAGTRQRRDAAFMAGYVRQPRVWMDPQLGLAYAELVEAARRAIAGLAPRCREVLVAVRFGGLSYKEAGATLGLSFRTVGFYLVEAQRVLAASLREWRTSDVQ